MVTRHARCDTGDMWNPDVYLAFADQRGRPFFDLLSRVAAENPRRVVDLGGGPGNLTVSLSQRCRMRRWRRGTARRRWLRPRERGIDAAVGDVRTWTPKPDTDVVVSNATLQWVPEHAELLVRWARQLAAGSWIAMQVPGNFDAPSHEAVRAVAAGRRSQTHCAICRSATAKWWTRPADTRTGSPTRVARSTRGRPPMSTKLSGEHPVLEWITGTALRPVIDRLSDEAWQHSSAAHPAARRGVPAATRWQDVLSVPAGIRCRSGELALPG